VALTRAISEVAARDPVLANLVALAGPLAHRPRDPDGHFGVLVRAIVFQQLAGPAGAPSISVFAPPSRAS
jgi:DNA-3-methyladenine glycosylase II